MGLLRCGRSGGVAERPVNAAVPSPGSCPPAACLVTDRRSEPSALAVTTSLLPLVAALATTIHWPSGENPTLWLMTVSVKCVIWVRAVPSGWTVKKLPFPDSSSATARKTIRFVEDQSGVPSAPADHGVS